LEATCPLVHYAHRAASELVREGYHPVVIGKRDHVEVRGLTEDLAAYDVVLCEADIDKLAEHPRFGVVAQTTQPLEKVRHLVDLIRRRFPASEVRFEDTVCQPTKQRQIAAVDLARESEVVVVVGGANSNNTQELVKTCRRFCERVYHVQDSSQLRPEWFECARVVGITAGTSTPDSTINQVGQWLEDLANHKTQQSEAEELASPLENGFSPTAEATSASQAHALAAPAASSFA
jgi:4-hydroxy-3-methylbut-2-enyl diphosphate reductase